MNLLITLVIKGKQFYFMPMPKKIQDFAKSVLVKPVIVNVGRAGAASLNVI